MSKNKTVVVVAIIIVIFLLSVTAGITIWMWAAGRVASAPSKDTAGVNASNVPVTAAPVNAPPPEQVDLTDLTSSDQLGRMVTALCIDAQNQVWVGTKAGGVRRYNPYAPADNEWTNFSDMTGNSAISSIAADHKGRVWVGLENHGLYIFDGADWQHFDAIASIGSNETLSGPLGDHLFRIAVCPSDGSVWMATNAGLTRYDDSTHQWSYFTRAEGLPSDATNCITFDAAGDIFVGTQCDGIAMATASDGYQHWKTVTGPFETSTTSTGDGLPSPCINDLATSSSDIIYAGTASGLAWSNDRGQSWKYQHGTTWIDKLSQRPEGLPSHFHVDPLPMGGDLINRLSADHDNRLYVAYAARGVKRFNCAPDGNIVADDRYPERAGEVLAFSSDMSRLPAIGGLDQGVVPSQMDMALARPQLQPRAVGLPPGAAPPSAEDLTHLLPTSGASAESAPIVVLDDDWRTQGTWLGRYGRDWGMFKGLGNQDLSSYYWGPGDQPSSLNCYVGPRSGIYLEMMKKDPVYDGPYYFIETLYDDQARYLEIPPVYFDSRLKQNLTTPDKNRTMAEVNDGDHVRKSGFWSPGLYYDMHVPDGPFVLSMYFVNNDGRHPGTSERDYSVELRVGMGSREAPVPGPPLARSRVVSFDNGVWKRFYIRGPIDLSVCTQKLSPPSIKWSAITLDHPNDKPNPYFSWQSKAPDLTTETPAGKLAAALRSGAVVNPAWWTLNQTRAAVMLLRWCVAQPQSEQSVLQATVASYHARLFQSYEESQTALGLRTARDVEQSLKWDTKWPNNSGQEARDLAAYVQSLAPAH